MQKLTISLLMLLFSSAGFAQEWSRCDVVQNGADPVAQVQMCSTSQFSGSGNGTIYLYDTDGNFIRTEPAIWIAVLNNGCQVVAQSGSVSNLGYCEFEP